MNRRTKIFIAVGAVLYVILMIVIFINYKSSTKTVPLEPNSGGNQTELNIVDEKSYLYNNLSTNDEYQGFINNLQSYIQKSGGSVTDTVYINSFSRGSQDYSYPQNYTVYSKSLNKDIVVVLNYSNENKEDVLFTIPASGYSNVLDMTVKDIY
jgi:hypothetical protein